MGLLNNIMDNFSKAEFSVAPNKKLKTISADFKKAFGVSLVFYKGVQIADGDLTLNQLNQKTTKQVPLAVKLYCAQLHLIPNLYCIWPWI